MAKRKQLRKSTINDTIERALVLLSNKEDQGELNVQKYVEEKNFLALSKFESDEWLPLKEELKHVIMF